MINRKFERLTMLIVFLSSLSLINFSHRCDEKRSVQTFIYINETKMKSTPVSSSPPRYLWCVNHYGPNSQLKDVVKCMVLAIMYNFTMILPPLYPHVRDTTRGIQRFEHFHDLDKLKHILNFVTLEQYINKRKYDQQHVTIDCYVHHMFRIHTKLHYGDHTLMTTAEHLNINFTINRNLNVSAFFSQKEFSRVTKFCSSIYLYMRFEWTWNIFRPLHRYVKLVMQYWDRSVLIHRLANEAMDYLKQTFLRNKTSNSSMILAVAHLRRGDHNVLPVEIYGKQLANLLKSGTNFTHLYVMCPFLKTKEIEKLHQIISVPLLTSDVLTNHLKVVMDEFLFDIVEQELGFHAPIFIGSPLSTYSATIYLRKLYQNKGDAYLFVRKHGEMSQKLTKDNVAYFDLS